MPRRSGGPPKAAAETEHDAEEVPSATSAKKPRATKLEAAKTKQAKLQARLTGLELRTGALEHALEQASSAKKPERDAALQKHLKAVEVMTGEVKAGATNVARLEEADGVKALQALKAAASTEKKAAMSVAAIRHLAQCRLEMQKQMDDKSNKNTNIWEQIHKAYNAAVEAGDLEVSDRRTVESLKAKFSLLDGSFKVHCRHIQRRKESGASAEDVGAQPA